MGTIKPEVKFDHLSRFRHELPLIEPLLNGFEISWARERKAFNTSLSVYILTPDRHVAETFGFNTQLALFIPHFEKMQPRAFQAINQILGEDPLIGRVDRNTFFVICQNDAEKKNILDYVSEHSKSWIPIVLTSTDLAQSKSARWGIRHPIASQIFTRDLFDQQLPLNSDIDFFGREALLYDFKDAILKTQNRGLFGLRKTGKTSVLFKVMRSGSEDQNQIILYYDCKKPRIRQLSDQKLLELICDDICSALGISLQFKDTPAQQRIEKIAAHVGKRKRICLIFDEIEYISFLAKLDPHWHAGYINFWQTLWALQSEFRNFCYFVAGVNPTVVEVDKISGIQNPLFGIVSYQYLTGLNIEELRRMLHILGKRMGLKFEEPAIQNLHKKYGGHPLLTRKACSHIHTTLLNQNQERPVEIDDGYIRNSESILDDNMEFYFKHILNELEDFYPDEYEMLKMLVSGQKIDFVELARDTTLRRHLESYGLIHLDSKTQVASFLIECLGSYLVWATARAEGRRHPIRIAAGEDRARWLRARTLQIVKEIRPLATVARKKLGIAIMPSDSIGEPEEFLNSKSASDITSFDNFINTCYRSFIEEIDRAGRAHREKDFFFHSFKECVPRLHDALHRVRAYRHWRFHSELHPSVKDAIKQYFIRDLGADRVASSSEDFMVLQQTILDEILLSILEEMAKLGD